MEEGAPAPTTQAEPKRSFEDELSFLKRESDAMFSIKEGFVDGMRVPGKSAHHLLAE